MKKLFSIFLVLLIFINTIIPSFAFASTAPEDPPEMPDWWKEKYGDKQIEHEDFKNKEIKTIKPPKKIRNPTPVGIAAGLALEFLVSQNEDFQALEEDFWEQVDKVDKELAIYLEDNFGIRNWNDVFHNFKSGIAYVTEQFVEAFNSFFSFEHEYTDIDYENLLRLLDPSISDFIHEKYKYDNDKYWIGPISYSYYSSSGDIPLMNVFVITQRNEDSNFFQVYRTWFTPSAYLSGNQTGGKTWGSSSTLEGAKNRAREEAIRMRETSRSEFIEHVERLKEQRESDITPKKYEIKNLGYLPNPYGSRLENPNDIEDLAEYETGIIEIDNEKYHIINVPNPNHTPHLDPTHPNYVPTHYPIIRPIIPVPNSPDINDPAHPGNPNNPYSPNNPNPQEVPEIPLIPDITPEPSPQPSPEPSPDPSPDPSPEPSPDPSPDPSTPQIPRAPEDDFGEGKGCGELNLDLKSIDMFTTKFPFSIPWDILRALEALFGQMGAEEPRFVLSFISDDTVLEIPQFIKDWVPLVRSIILFLFDVSVIYALYRWFGGAS